ncbi:hypothetical protein ACVWZ8_004229 [Arthrobacter sp. UYCu723]
MAGCITMSAPRSRTGPDRITALSGSVLATARTVSARLGHRPRRSSDKHALKHAADGLLKTGDVFQGQLTGAVRIPVGNCLQ